MDINDLQREMLLAKGLADRCAQVLDSGRMIDDQTAQVKNLNTRVEDLVKANTSYVEQIAGLNAEIAKLKKPKTKG